MPDRPATISRKPHPPRPGRKRRLAGWLLLAIGVLITGVWGASGWWWFAYTGDSSGAALGRGTVLFYQSHEAHNYATNRPGWDRTYLGAEWEWTVAELVPPNADRAFNACVAGYMRGWGYTRIAFTLWPFALASLLGSGLLLWSGRRARRRAMTNVCPKCGYDLRGLAAGAQCPECGNSAQAAG